jgi:hypothetical protein
MLSGAQFLLELDKVHEMRRQSSDSGDSPPDLLGVLFKTKRGKGVCTEQLQHGLSLLNR